MFVILIYRTFQMQEADNLCPLLSKAVAATLAHTRPFFK